MRKAVRYALAPAAALALIAAAQSAPNAWTSARGDAPLNAVAPAAISSFHWHAAFPAVRIFSRFPSIGGDSVYFASAHYTYRVNLYTGSTDWAQLAGNEVSGAPIVYGGLVIAGVGNSEIANGVIGTGSSDIVALDAATGKQVWWHGLKGTGLPSGAIVDGVYVHHDGSGAVEALDPKTGSLLWSVNVGSKAVHSAITPAGGNLVVTGGKMPNAVTAVNLATHAIAWQRKFSADALGLAEGPLAVDNGTVFGTYAAPAGGKRPGFAQHLFALDARTGKVRYDTAIDTGAVPASTTAAVPACADGKVFVGAATSPTLLAVDETSGKIVWSARLRGTALGGAAVKDGAVYAGDAAGTLWALDERTGRVIGKTAMSDSFAANSPVIAGDTLIIAGKLGHVFAEPLADIRASSTEEP